MRIKAAIEADDDAVAILGPAEAQAVYLDGLRRYEVPSLDIRLVTRGKEELVEPLMVQFNGHGRDLQDIIDIGTMLERLFDRDTWYELDDIYLWSSRLEDGPEDGPDKHGRFHQSWTYTFEPPRSKYVNEVVDS